MTIDDVVLNAGLALCGGAVAICLVGEAYMRISDLIYERKTKKQIEADKKKGITGRTRDYNGKHIVTGVLVGKVPVSMHVAGLVDAYAEGNNLVIPGSKTFSIDQSKKEAYLYAGCCDGLQISYPTPLKESLSSLKLDVGFSPCCGCDDPFCS